MKTLNAPQTLAAQFCKPMLSLYDYVPMRFEATPREKQIRSLIWDFKDGKRTKQVAAIVAAKILEKFGSFAENIVFACVPASSADRTETRYRDFCEEVARLSGCINGYNAIRVEGQRLAVHETRYGKAIKNTEVISFNADFFNGARVLVFDDVLTRGNSYATFANALEELGAEVLGGLFLGKTVTERVNDDSNYLLN